MNSPSPSFFRAIVAVLWAMIGIRKGKASLTDQGVKPVHIVFAGVLAVGAFVATLLIIVRIILRSST